ncbi:hypothetical protein CY35_07G024600 [Sphagnum magellanicum]|uniref:Uncharacterized protein n=1 Tax=Sphagnum magellanicum TaxID=128215 RepID=A0ACB8HKY0_9BRYO|nr:hypothetical protein CY35_07G024600 [Sphagnum magellanicum]
MGSALSGLDLTDKVRDEVNLYDELGSVLLLQGLYDLWPGYEEIQSEVQKILRKLKSFLPSVPDTKVDVDLIDEDKFVDDWPKALLVVEEELVSYLRSKSELAAAFQNYLPKQDQSWREFFETKLKVSESDLRFVHMHVRTEVYFEFIVLVQLLLEGKPPQAPEDTDRHTHIGKSTGQRHVPCAVAAAWVDGRFNGDDFDLHLLPRFYLLQALCDKLVILASTYKTSALRSKFFREISGFFALILDAARSDGPDGVSQMVDRFLVPCLQMQSEVAKLLRDYLPKRYQSWKAFIDIKLSVKEKKFFRFSENLPDHTVQLELSNACKFLLEEFKLKHGLHSRLHAYFPISSDLKFKEVDVFYATDRLVTVDGEYIGQHSTSKTWREDNRLHYGRITVGVRDINIPSAVEPSVRILSMDTTLHDDQAGFVKMINQLAKKERQMLLYIHGYNVNHKDAIMCAAQLKHNTSFPGLVMVYSWPSEGTLWHYDHDEEMIEKSADLLHGFIKTILTEVLEDTKVHICADNMGCRALISAFAFPKSGKGKESQHETIMKVDVKRTLTSVTFWAPDAKWTEFESMDLENMFKLRMDQKLPCIFRVYSSDTDWNLLLSKVLHKESQLVDTKSLSNKFSHMLQWPIHLLDLPGDKIHRSLIHSHSPFEITRRIHNWGTKKE